MESAFVAYHCFAGVYSICSMILRVGSSGIIQCAVHGSAVWLVS